MHFVTFASIHVVSSVSPLMPSLGFPAFGGEWNATIRPSCKGNCLARASLRAFGSRENDGCGPTEPRCVMGIELPRPFEVTIGVEALDGRGECARGRFMRFSETEESSVVLTLDQCNNTSKNLVGWTQ